MARRRSIAHLLRRHRVGAKLTWIVILLQGAMLLTLAVTPPMLLPPRVRFFELIWASMHEPTFYPLVALLIGGPVLSMAALRLRGLHRAWLVASWIAFGVVIYIYHQDRMITMLRALYWSLTR